MAGSGEAALGDSETGEGVFDRKRRDARGIEGGRRARRRRRILFVQIVLHAGKPSVFRLRAPCWQSLHPAKPSKGKKGYAPRPTCESSGGSNSGEGKAHQFS